MDEFVIPKININLLNKWYNNIKDIKSNEINLLKYKVV